MTTNYLITKETTAYVQCPDCTAGFRISQFRGVKTKVACNTCNGTMRKKVTHRTEVTLEQALNELGLINNNSNEKQ